MLFSLAFSIVRSMSITAEDTDIIKLQHGNNSAGELQRSGGNVTHKNYKGFVAGVFSGIAKLSGKVFRTLMLKLY